MADKNINIHIKAKGADQTQRQLKDTAAATDQMGNKTAQAGRRGKSGMDDLRQGTAAAGEQAKKSTGLFANMLGKLGAMAGGVVGIHLVTDAIRAQTAAMKENVQAARDQQNALLRLQFLGDYYKENPNLRKEVAADAEYGRRPFEEVADARYNLRSKNAGMSEPQQRAMFQEVLEMGRTDPSMPLNTLSDMFSLYTKKSGEMDFNRAQNVLQKTIEEAGGTGEDVANYMPRFLPIGMAGGLSAPEASGLWAYATTQTGDSSVATTGLKALFLGLEGKGTPESAKMLNELGVDPNADFFTKIDRLAAAKKKGTFGLGQAEQVAGREGADILLSILDDPEGLSRTIQSVKSANRSDVDLTRNKIEGLFGTDPVARKEEELRQLEIRIKNRRADDTDSLLTEELIKEQELVSRGRSDSEIQILKDRWSLEGMRWVGFSPDQIKGFLEKGNEINRVMNEGPTTVIHNNNVVYNHPAQAARARVTPEDTD